VTSRWLPAAVLAGSLAAGIVVGRQTEAAPNVNRERHGSPRGAAPVGNERVSNPPKSKLALAPPVSTETAPSTPVATSKILSELLPLLPDEDLERLVDITVYCDGDSQEVVLDLLFETDDPDYYELLRDFCISYDRAVEDRVLAAFETETHPSRRAELAQALGSLTLNPSARAQVESILRGRDPVLLERVLSFLRVSGIRGQSEPIIHQLKEIAITGPTLVIRARAAGALEGDESEEGIQYLVTLALDDPAAKVQERALEAIVLDDHHPEAFKREIMSTLLAAVMDSNRPLEFRRLLAKQLTASEFYGVRKLWSREEKELLNQMRQ
jgi:hypothetical protein